MLLTKIEVLDEVLQAHAADIGPDFAAYRNHTYRVANLCLALSPDGADLDKIAVAAALHDMGIWTAGTFDYLPPSIDLARDYLARSGRADWTPEVVEMITQHHKILPYRKRPDWLVEPFRRADWADVSRGVVARGVSRALMRDLYAAWPAAGFHVMLVRLELRRLRTHPFNPLPMVRL